MFKGLGNIANVAGLFKQAQEMGGKIGQLGEELKAQRVVGKAGGGLVEVLATGTGEVLAVRIDPSLMEKQDRELLEDLLPAAFNDARQKAQELHAQQLQQLTGGLNLPGLGDILGQAAPDTTRE